MYNYTPLTKEVPYPWEFKDGDAWLSYANRDEHNTKWTVRTPAAVRAVGEPLQVPFNSLHTPEAAGHFPNLDAFVQIPAFCTFDMVPVYAGVKSEGAPDEDPYWERLDVDVWNIKHRDLASMLKVVKFDFEPIDLQFYHSAIMELLAQIAQLMRGMDAYNDTGNPNNAGALNYLRIMDTLGYIDGLGAAEDVHASDNSFNSLIAFVNKQIIGPLRQSYWFWNLIPATYYHAGLYSKIFMDANVPGVSCSCYIFRSKYFMNPKFKNTDSTFTMEKVPFEGNIRSLWKHAEAIANAIWRMINDESFRSIQIALEQLNQKNPKIGDTMQFSYGDLEFYPYPGRPLQFTYDPAMLLTIHNMTVVDGGDTSNVEEVIGQDDKPNQLVQTFTMNADDPMQEQILKMRVMLDLPGKLGPEDWAQVIAATQFTVCSWDGQPTTEHALSPKILGLSMCVGSSMHIFRDPFDNGSYTTFKIPTYIPMYLNTSASGAQEHRDNCWKLCMLLQFKNYPLTRLIRAKNKDTLMTDGETMGWLADLQQVHVLDFNQLQSVKSQFYYNAYGYPIRVGAEGTFAGYSELTKASDEAHKAAIVVHENGNDEEVKPTATTDLNTSTGYNNPGPKRPRRRGSKDQGSDEGTDE